MKFSFSFWKAFSWIDFAARSSLRRWITVTLRANFVRYMASSTAASPPPTTYTSKVFKKRRVARRAEADALADELRPRSCSRSGRGNAPVDR
jgi:hypothetical protein